MSTTTTAQTTTTFHVSGTFEASAMTMTVGRWDTLQEAVDAVPEVRDAVAMPGVVLVVVRKTVTTTTTTTTEIVG